MDMTSAAHARVRDELSCVSGGRMNNGHRRAVSCLSEAPALTMTHVELLETLDLLTDSKAVTAKNNRSIDLLERELLEILSSLKQSIVTHLPES